MAWADIALDDFIVENNRYAVDSTGQYHQAFVVFSAATEATDVTFLPSLPEAISAEATITTMATILCADGEMVLARHNSNIIFARQHDSHGLDGMLGKRTANGTGPTTAGLYPVATAEEKYHWQLSGTTRQAVAIDGTTTALAQTFAALLASLAP